MKLSAFRITDFRSINDSGPVTVSKITSLVGRNESGKSNLLLALHTLNPAGGVRDLSPIKDFPRHRRLDECKDDTAVVHSTWELEAAEQVELAAMFPRAAGITHVEIGRAYKAPTRWVNFVELKAVTFSGVEVAGRLRKIAPVVEAEIDKLDDALKGQATSALELLKTNLSASSTSEEWAARAAPTLASFRKALATAGIVLPDREDGLIGELEDLAASIVNDAPAWQKARTWIVGRLPIFVYVADYPDLVGHQNIGEYLTRKAANPTKLTESDYSFEKMCKVAGINPQQLHKLNSENDHETRNQLANRASAVVTTELRRLWKDRQLKVRFNPDGNHLDTLISDPNTVYDVEVNLDERSRGLKWFFSFYITFWADTQGGTAENAILLLDEPGMHLHALSQGDLLRHLTADFKNQIVYSTHSPFMVPTENLDSVRTVNIGQDTGTTVTDNPTGDSRTLFPIQMALGYSLSQSLFVGPDNIVVEGVTDYWILASISEYLQGIGKPALPKQLTITPAGGAQKIGYMVALLTSERLRVLVLFDDEKQARNTKEELVRSKLVRDENVVFVTEGFTAATKPAEADIEDLLDADVFDQLVRESYEIELRGKTLSPNAMIPRIVKRYENAFTDIGLKFHKTRPARLLLTKMGKEPNKIITPGAADRFAHLFEEIGKRHTRNTSRNGTPFQ
jgi:predicted ATPase